MAISPIHDARVQAGDHRVFREDTLYWRSIGVWGHFRHHDYRSLLRSYFISNFPSIHFDANGAGGRNAEILLEKCQRWRRFREHEAPGNSDHDPVEPRDPGAFSLKITSPSPRAGGNGMTFKANFGVSGVKLERDRPFAPGFPRHDAPIAKQKIRARSRRSSAWSRPPQWVRGKHCGGRSYFRARTRGGCPDRGGAARYSSCSPCASRSDSRDRSNCAPRRPRGSLQERCDPLPSLICPLVPGQMHHKDHGRPGFSERGNCFDLDSILFSQGGWPGRQAIPCSEPVGWHYATAISVRGR